jgi:O-antigen/teichoic acid export membrane protein
VSSAAGDTRRYGRTAGLVTAGIALSGVLLYSFFALASHSLSHDEYGDIIALWLVTFASVSTLFRPVEQLLAREIAIARASGGSPRHALRSAAAIALGLFGAFALVAFLAREPLTDGLFSGDDFLFWALVAGVLTFACDYYVRGVVAGRGRFDLYAAQLVAECGVLAGVGALAAAGTFDGDRAFAVAIAVAPLLGLGAVGLVLASGHGTRAAPPDPTAGTAALARHSGFAVAVLIVMFSEQVLVNAGPLFVRAGEGAAIAGFVFNELMIARAPAALFQGVAASLLPHLAALRASGDSGSAFGEALRGTVVGVAVFSAALAVGAVTIGPPLLDLVFGGEFSYGRGELLLIAVGTGFLLAGATLTQAALVRGRAGAAATAWAVGAAAFLAWNAIGALEPEQRVAAGFAGACALTAAALWLVYRRGDSGDVLAPGSADELQARLATAEEFG